LIWKRTVASQMADAVGRSLQVRLGATTDAGEDAEFAAAGKTIEFPIGFRELTEKSLAQSKETYDKMKAAAEDATGALEGTFSMAAKGTADYNRKVIEVARANANAAFDYARDLLDAKSISDVAEVSSTHARKQFEAFSQQTKDLATHSQSGGQFFGIHASNNGKIMIFAGGIPLKKDGKVVGAIGVSGGSGDQDHAVAAAGAAAF